MEQVNNKLTIEQVRKALRSQRGSIRELADVLDVSPPAVTLVLQGKLTSARILSAATDRALAILANQKVA